MMSWPCLRNVGHDVDHDVTIERGVCSIHPPPKKNKKTQKHIKESAVEGELEFKIITLTRWHTYTPNQHYLLVLMNAHWITGYRETAWEWESDREYAPLCNQVPLVLDTGNNHMHINATTAVRTQGDGASNRRSLKTSYGSVFSQGNGLCFIEC